VHAWDDVKALTYQISHGHLRKSVPRWALPLELWRMVLCPNRYVRPRVALGLGCEMPHYALARLDQCVLWLFYAIRRTNRAPFLWSHAAVALIDKNNNKDGCPGLRVTALLDSLGKAYFRHLWRRCCCQKSSAMGLWLC